MNIIELLERKMMTGEPVIQQDIDDVERLTTVPVQPVQEPDFVFISTGYEIHRQKPSLTYNQSRLNLGELDVVVPDEIVQKCVSKFNEAPLRLGITILDQS